MGLARADACDKDCSLGEVAGASLTLFLCGISVPSFAAPFAILEEGRFGLQTMWLAAQKSRAGTGGDLHLFSICLMSWAWVLATGSWSCPAFKIKSVAGHVFKGSLSLLVVSFRVLCQQSLQIPSASAGGKAVLMQLFLAGW